jgi:hypothetical protein
MFFYEGAPHIFHLGSVWFRGLQSVAALFYILRMEQLYSMFGR